METYTNICKIAGGDLRCDSGSSSQGSGTAQRGGVGWEVGGKLRREGTRVYLWLICVHVWQK